jgi:hypothetical protein
VLIEAQLEEQPEALLNRRQNPRQSAPPQDQPKQPAESAADKSRQSYAYRRARDATALHNKT